MNAARLSVLAATVLLASCQGLGGNPRVMLEWPEAVLPAGASDLHYEVAVWARDGDVPTQRLLHRERVTGHALRVDSAGWPPDICWSVRARWLENGRLRKSRWLAANGEPVTTALVPSRELAGD